MQIESDENMDSEYFKASPAGDIYSEIQGDYLKNSYIAKTGRGGEDGESAYRFEKLVLSYIEAGQAESLESLLNTVKSFKEGNMAENSLRRKKNGAICCAALSARAAISGGMDPADAFCLSDLYIQKIELTNDIPTAERLMREMMADYAVRVGQLKFSAGKESMLIKKCVSYISQNIYSPVSAADLAAETGYARTYLSNQFKKQMGISLSEYILREKVVEAERLLRFTDETLCEIASQLSFSSQSHFQTVFKKFAGETPLSFRQKTGKNKI